MQQGRSFAQQAPGSCFVSGMGATDDEQMGALAMVHALRALGLRVVAMSPIVTDAVRQSGRWTSPHLERLARAGSFQLPASVLSPYLRPSAACQDPVDSWGQTQVDTHAVIETYDVLSTWADAVVVQGVGGLEKAVGPSLSVHDIVARMALPLVLTLRADSGAMERADRALALAQAKSLQLVGWLACGVTAETEKLVPQIASRLGLALLGVLPLHSAEIDSARHLDLPVLKQRLSLSWAISSSSKRIAELQKRARDRGSAPDK